MRINCMRVFVVFILTSGFGSNFPKPNHLGQTSFSEMYLQFINDKHVYPWLGGGFKHVHLVLISSQPKRSVQLNLPTILLMVQISQTTTWDV